MFDDNDTARIEGARRDGVGPLTGDTGASPSIVSVSDIHGFLSSARKSLLTLSDHPDYDPVVTTDPVRRLQWAGNDYVVVFNGDLVDRGPQSEDVLEMVARLMRQAPPGRVRVVFGNHEMGILTPDRFDWPGRYSVELTDDERRAFLDRIRDGHVVAAYEGYNVTYAHAGRPERYDVTALNESLVSAAETLREGVGTAQDGPLQRRIIEEYPAVLGLGGRTGRGRGAGVAWLDFEYLPADAPPQVVGHTRHDEPTRDGNVICENVIRNNRRSEGGEAVVVESPDRVVALRRGADGTVEEHEFTLPERVGPS